MNAVNTGMSSSNNDMSNSRARNHALISYALMTLGLFTAVPIILGAIWAMVKRSDSVDTIYYSHYTNAIKTFWWGLAWTIIGTILHVVIIGYAILAAAWIWALYRLVRGLAKIIDDEPYPS